MVLVLENFTNLLYFVSAGKDCVRPSKFFVVFLNPIVHRTQSNSLIDPFYSRCVREESESDRFVIWTILYDERNKSSV